jgi:hypothetical protein
MEELQAFQAGAGEGGFVVATQSKDGTVLWFRKTTPDALGKAHHRLCLDSITKSATVYWTNDRGLTDSKTFRSVAALREWLEKVRNVLKSLKLSEDPDIVLIDARNDNKPAGSKA